MKLFLSSMDYRDFEHVREVLSYHKTQMNGTDILIVKVDIPIIGQKYGLADYDPDTLYLSDKWIGEALMKLSIFPIHVNVMMPKDRDVEPQSLSDLNLIAWASLYDNKGDAMEYR